MPLQSDIDLPEQRSGISDLHYYNHQHVHKTVYFLSTVLASLTPMVAVIALFLVNNESIRIGLVTAFTFLFALVLALATKARRIEIFAATAA